MTIGSRCICTGIGGRALAKIVESHADSATYIDSHPWIVARELLDEVAANWQRLPMLFASGNPVVFSHWTFIVSIEVHKLHHGAWETHCGIERLKPVNPIWEPLDSVVLAPSREQLHRESVEPVHIHRQMLDEQHIWPYAVCETPAFIAEQHP